MKKISNETHPYTIGARWVGRVAEAWFTIIEWTLLVALLHGAYIATGATSIGIASFASYAMLSLGVARKFELGLLELAHLRDKELTNDQIVRRRIGAVTTAGTFTGFLYMAVHQLVLDLMTVVK